jgi:hypothetical protein
MTKRCVLMAQGSLWAVLLFSGCFKTARFDQRALIEKGLSSARIERFQNAVVDCIVNAAKSIV